MLVALTSEKHHKEQNKIERRINEHQGSVLERVPKIFVNVKQVINKKYTAEYGQEKIINSCLYILFTRHTECSIRQDRHYQNRSKYLLHHRPMLS